LALALLVILGVRPGAAHTGGTTGFAQVTVQGQTIRYRLTLGLDALERATSDPANANQLPLGPDYEPLVGLVTRHTTITADGAACVPVPGNVQPPAPGRSSVTIVIHYACAAPVRTLSLRDDLFNVLGREHHTLANVEWSGGHQQVLLEPDRRETRVTIDSAAAQQPAAGPLSDGALGFLRLGVEHILEGFDHILFIFALILGGGRLRSLLVIVTAFTVAHSITLALATLDLVRPPGWLIEPLIALSIAYVAFENIFMERAPSRRWLVSLLFGLVHGFGFAGALVELGLPEQALFSSLLFFNLGVEAGQALIVAVLFPALLWLSRFPWKQRAVTSISAVVLVAAIALLAERTLSG
jgi:hypothetical protein